MRNIRNTALVLSTIASLGMMIAPALAQDGARREQGVDRVQENQQDRIGQGVKSGQLTAGEAARLEHNQASINRETNRLGSDGQFTKRDARMIDRRQDRQSRAIYRLKHNGRHG